MQYGVLKPGSRRGLISLISSYDATNLHVHNTQKFNYDLVNRADDLVNRAYSLVNRVDDLVNHAYDLVNRAHVLF